MDLTIGNLIIYAIIGISIYYGIKLYMWIQKIKYFKNQFVKKSGYVEPDLYNRFSKSKIPENLDYIIIGSGTSGLASAGTLSKLGKKVLVLEQHDRIGGCFHTFTEQGYEFDTGFHYVGNSREIKLIQKYLGGKDIKWNTFNHYDNIQLDQEKYKLIAPVKDFYAQLEKDFPENVKEVRIFKNLSKRVFKMQNIMYAANFSPSFLRILMKGYLKLWYSDIYMKSANEVMKNTGIDKNPKLKLVLCGNCLDIGSNLDETPFAMQALLQSHYYMKGSMYPQNGTTDIIKSFAGAILANGGTLLTKASVQKIIVNNGKVQGVQLKGNIEIFAKKVISTMGVPNTIEALPEKFQWKNKYRYNDAFNCINVFLGIDTKGMERSELPTYNTWYYPPQKGDDGKENWDFEFMQKNALKEQDKEHRGLFITFPSVKGDLENEKHSCCIISESRWEFFEKFRINEVRREDGYKELKKKILDQVVSKFLEIYPQFKDRIEYQDLGTPLTNETYYGRKTPYGLHFTKEKFYSDDFMHATTPVQNLYLSGQDICFPGIIGGLIIGVLSAVQAEKLL